eukprot:GDKI01033819.1.p1 GENE.GDKI01033819.1~~GDKI01033819.1.p1  ORF type:complete len:160 (+),score=19.37 GDKI01033819.1:146-625(+)
MEATPPSNDPVWPVLLLCVGVFLLTIFFAAHIAVHCSSRRVVVHTWLRQLPATTPHELAHCLGSTVKVVGRIALHKERRLTAPFSGRTCVYYQVRVDQLRVDGDTLVTVPITEETRSVPFLLVPEEETVSAHTGRESVLVPCASDLSVPDCEGQSDTLT